MKNDFNWEEFDIICASRLITIDQVRDVLRWCKDLATELGVERILKPVDPDPGFDERARHHFATLEQEQERRRAEYLARQRATVPKRGRPSKKKVAS